MTDKPQTLIDVILKDQLTKLKAKAQRQAKTFELTQQQIYELEDLIEENKR